MLKKQSTTYKNIIKTALFKAAEFAFFAPKNTLLNLPFPSIRSSVFWMRPDSNYVKLNIDGSAKANLVGAGGLLRDCHGNWVSGFSVFIGYGTSFSAELWGIIKGIQLALSLNIKKLIIETDSLVSQRLILSPDSYTHHPLCSLISNCRFLLTLLEDWKLNHVLREANFCADSLANFGRTSQLHYTVFDTLPSFLHLLFLLEVGMCRRRKKPTCHKPPQAVFSFFSLLV